MSSIKKIACLLPPHSNYGTMLHYTEEMHAAFLRAGIESHLYASKLIKEPMKLLEQIMRNPPDCTFSFNGLLPDREGRFFADITGIPHIAYLLDSPLRFTPLYKSKRTWVICPDRDLLAYAQKCGAPNAFFLPVGVETHGDPLPAEERKYDITLVASAMDDRAILKKWEEDHSPIFAAALEEQAELTLTTPHLSYLDSLLKAVQKADPDTLALFELMKEFEDYIRAKERRELVSNIEGCSLHIYGAAIDNHDWKTLIPHPKTDITFHRHVPFEQALHVMHRSKIVLNSCPSFKQGLHTRMLCTLDQGALPLTTNVPYIQEAYPESAPPTFTYGQWSQMNDTIADLLNKDSWYPLMLEGRKQTQTRHTWDHRVATLLKHWEEN